MRAGRLGFQKLILAAEIGVILGGVSAFGLGHSWFKQPELGSVLNDAGTLASELAEAGSRFLEDLVDDGDLTPGQLGTKGSD